MQSRRRKRVLSIGRSAKINARCIAMDSFIEAIGIELMPWQRAFMRSVLRRTIRQKIADSTAIHWRRNGMATVRVAIQLAEKHLRDVLESRPND